MAQFPLLMNGAEVCTLEDLKKNFNPADLVACRKRFAAWLKGWDYDEEAVEVKFLDLELTDEQWLKSVCEIIGISAQELAASQKKNEATAKLEQEKIAIQQAEEQKRKVEQERKKKIIPTPENINVEISARKSPFVKSIYSVCIGEGKGVLVSTTSDQLYYSSNGEKFVPVIVDDASEHDYRDFIFLNGYFIFQDNSWENEGKIFFSQDGCEWNSFHWSDAVSDKDKYKFVSIGYNDSCKEFFIFYSAEKVVNYGDSIVRAICHGLVTSHSLNGPWKDKGIIDINSVYDRTPGKFYYGKGKYFTDVWDGDSNYGFNKSTDSGVYYSEDGIHWTQADESDLSWLESLDVIENANQWIHVDYCNCKDGVKRYFLEVSRVIPWGEIYFSHGDDTIKAWKEDFEKQPVSEECDFAIKTVACFNDKLLIFGENNEFAIGEISVLSPEQAKPDHSAQSTKTKSPQISPEEALLNSMQNMAKRLEELNKLF